MLTIPTNHNVSLFKGYFRLQLDPSLKEHPIWSNDLSDKSSGCSSRGSVPFPASIWCLITICNFSPWRYDTLLDSVGTRHECNAQKHRQAEHSCT